MSDAMTELFTGALGLASPWRVERVRFRSSTRFTSTSSARPRGCRARVVRRRISHAADRENRYPA